MDDLTRLNLLNDFYGSLLSGRMAQVVQLYIEENLSLSEIADAFGLSRQGVHDHLKRGIKALQDYECKLHLLERYQTRCALYQSLMTLREQNQPDDDVIQSILKFEDISVQYEA